MGDRRKVEHFFLASALEVSLAPVDPAGGANVMYLRGLAEEYRSEVREPILAVADGSRIIVATMTQLMAKKRRDVLLYISHAFTRALDKGSGKNREPDETAWMAELQALLVDHAAMVATCTELYADHWTWSDTVEAFVHLWDFPLRPNYVDRVLAVIRATDDRLAQRLLADVLSQYALRLSSVSIKDLKLDCIATLRRFVASEFGAKAFATHPLFAPPASTSAMKDAKSGWALQTQSLLGLVLRATPCDATVTRHRERLVVQYFDHDVLTISQLQQGMMKLRRDHECAIEQATQLLKDLCRYEESREAVFDWFALVCDSCALRIKMGASLSRTPHSIEPTHELWLNVSGEITFGFGLNVLWVLLKLAVPVRIDKIFDRATAFLHSNSKTAIGLKKTLDTSEPLGAAPAEFWKSSQDDVFSFSTQLFIIVFTALRYLYRPAIAELGRIYSACAADDLERSSPTFKLLATEVYAWQSVLYNRTFVGDLWNFVNKGADFHLRTLFLYDSQGQLHNERVKKLTELGNIAEVVPFLPFDASRPFSSTRASPQLWGTPAMFLETIFEVGKAHAHWHSKVPWGKEPWVADPLYCCDTKMLVTLCLAVVTHPSAFPNVHTRCDGAVQILFLLFTHCSSLVHFDTWPVCRDRLVAGLVQSFVDSQKATFYDRLNFRLPVVVLLSDILTKDALRSEFVRHNTANPATFIHFVHLLICDTSELMENAISGLMEIHRRQSTGLDRETPVSEETEDNDAVQALDAEANLASLSWPTMMNRCRTAVLYSHKTAVLFKLVCEYTADPILSESALCAQAAVCLNCMLDHLVGPRCMRLKVKNMELYNFKPKEWLGVVCETFLALGNRHSSSDSNVDTSKELGYNFLAEVKTDGRFFAIEHFTKAAIILRREDILPRRTRDLFNQLITNIADGIKVNDYDIDETEVPDKYLDPVMSEIMADPVSLPTSGSVMDRKHIVRHLMSEPTDPFNRVPLTLVDLVPLPDLQREIEDWVIEYRRQKNEKKISETLEQSQCDD